MQVWKAAFELMLILHRYVSCEFCLLNLLSQYNKFKYVFLIKYNGNYFFNLKYSKNILSTSRLI